MEQILIDTVKILVSSVIAMMMTVFTHEIGHLIGGFISGYHFVYIQFFKLRIYRENGGIKIAWVKCGPTGQCVMVPDNLADKPYKLVAGGCIMNFILGIIFLVFSLLKTSLFFYSDLYNRVNISFYVVIPIFSALSLALGMYNFFGTSDYLDGTTLCEIYADNKNIMAYNCLMYIYSELIRNTSITEIDEKFFCAQSMRSSILAELTLYSCKRSIAKIKESRFDNEEMKKIRGRLCILVRSKYPSIVREAKEYIKELDKIY